MRSGMQISSEHQARTLLDLGERSILQDVIVPTLAASRSGLQGIGDDCAELPAPPPGHKLLVTTDPCPSPVVFEIEDPDYWHYGWMTVLINVSDLSAMGATPIAIVVSCVMPNDMPVADFRRFMDGLADAADEWRCPVVGGNIKDGPGFTATGTAIGSAEASTIMRRTGGQPGDVVCVLGRMGLFWAAILRRLHAERVGTLPEGLEQDLRAALHRPAPRYREGPLLAASRLVTCAMDASDGVGGCLEELARRNGCDIVVSDSQLVPAPAVGLVAERVGVDPRKLLLSWGNWELVFTVRPESVEELQALAERHDWPLAVIGEMRPGSGSVQLERDHRATPLVSFASERFVNTSYFTYGLESYVNWLMRTPLTKGAPAR